MTRCTAVWHEALTPDQTFRCVLPAGHPPVTDRNEHATEDRWRKAVYFTVTDNGRPTTGDRQP